MLLLLLSKIFIKLFLSVKKFVFLILCFQDFIFDKTDWQSAPILQLTNNMSSKPLFSTKHSFLNIYVPKETVNDPSFHYYSEPRDGLYKISLLRKSARKPLTMYYESKNI